MLLSCLVRYKLRIKQWCVQWRECEREREQVRRSFIQSWKSEDDKGYKEVSDSETVTLESGKNEQGGHASASDGQAVHRGEL